MAQAASVEDLRRQVLEIAGRLMREHRIQGAPSLDVPLGEDGLGLDSVGCLDLMGAIETECGLLLPEKYWTSRRLRDLNELIKVAARR
jgi:acyl carrier protein